MEQTKPHSHAPSHPQAVICWRTRVSNCLPVAAFLLLTVTAADSAYRSRGDPSAFGFVSFSYAVLALLFFCLRSLERLAPDCPPEKREGLKAAVWLLSTALNLAFSWRVAQVTPPVLGVVVWVAASVVTVGGFYFLFIYSDAESRNLGKAYRVVESKALSPEEKV